MNLGENIRYIRNLRGITLEQLGNSVGLSSQYLSMFERGLKTPDVHQLVSICFVLKCTPNDLLGFYPRKEMI